MTTGEPGSQAAVTNSGTQQNAVLNFTIPRGDAGTGSQPVTLLSAYSTPVQNGTSGTALIFDRNGLSYGSAISHASNSAAFTINTPGVYMTSFQGVINPASGVNFPLSITLTLQQGGSGVPGGGVLHTFHTSADAAVLPIAVPVAVTSAPLHLTAGGDGRQLPVQRHHHDHHPAGGHSHRLIGRPPPAISERAQSALSF